MAWKMLCIVPHKVFADPTASGVGTYIQGFKDLDVDILDEGSNEEALSKSEWMKNLRGFGFDPYKVARIAESILRKFESSPYRCIVCSTFEAVEACISLGLPELMPVYYRTHNSHIILGSSGHGSEKAHELLLRAKSKGVRIAANSDSAYYAVTQRYEFPACHAHVLQNVIDIKVVSVTKVPNSLLIIGRYDDVKRPKLAARIAFESGFKVFVMTGSKRQEAKWEKTLLAAGCSDFEIVSGLTGDDKWRYIAKCQVSLHTSEIESFANAVIESIPYTHTFIVCKDYDWSTDYHAYKPENFSVRVHMLDVKARKSANATISRIVNEMQSLASKPVISAKKLKQTSELWREITVNAWKRFIESNSLPSKGKALQSDLARDLDAGKRIAWADYYTGLPRQIEALHKYIAQNPRTKYVKGSIYKG